MDFTLSWIKEVFDVGNDKPIGIFDSGVGGLTVVKSLIQELPQENFIYFGDTAHVPYGNKTVEQLFNYAYDITNFLIKQSVKAIIVACGTTSSITLPKLSTEYDLPMLGVVKPGAIVAAKATRNGKIGVLATQATVNSQAYTISLKEINPLLEVREVGCPKLVPLIEAGNLEGEETKTAVDEYLAPLLAEGIDTIVLGCTHYPFLSRVIKEYVGEKVELIDLSLATINELKALLATQHLLNETVTKYDPARHQETEGNYSENGMQKEPSPLHLRRFLVSGNDESFYKVGNLLLNNIISAVEKVDLDGEVRDA